VLIFGYEIYKQRTDELIAEGETVHVITDREGRPRTLPNKYRELLLGKSEIRNQKSEIRKQER
jgi:acyl-CoA thioesterase FadM